MRFISTRGEAAVSLKEALLLGAPGDGGFYVPETWPELSGDELAGFRAAPLSEVLGAVLAKLAGDDLPEDVWRDAATEAAAAFAHAATVPLVQLYPHVWLAEQFHGPALAPADIEMQVLARVYEALAARDGKGITLWLAANPVDAAAAVEAFHDRPGLRLAVLFAADAPEDARRRVTATGAANIRAFAVAGSLADCVALAAARRSGAKRHADIGYAHPLRLIVRAAVIIALSARLGADLAIAGEDEAAVLAARRMGAPVTALAGGGWPAALRTGRLDRRAINSVERLYFEAVNREARETALAMAALNELGFIDIPPRARAALSDWLVLAEPPPGGEGAAMLAVHNETGVVLDPATARAAAAAKTASGPVIVLSGPHPWLSHSAVEATLGETLPAPSRAIHGAGTPESYTAIAADQAALTAALSWA